jgi:hypothetical protein
MVAISCAGCSALTDDRTDLPLPPVPSPSSTFQPEVTAPATVILRVCGDGTGSTSNVSPKFPGMMRSYVADAVAGWSVVQNPDSAGHGPQPGMDFRMRWVGADPYALLDGIQYKIPGVPGLVGEPAATDPGFSTNDPSWQADEADVISKSEAAARLAVFAAKGIRSYDWPRGPSDVWGCISAVTADMPAKDGKVLIFSDGEQNQPPQIAVKLNGAKVLWILPCPSGVADHCEALKRSWRSQLVTLGADPNIQFLYPDSVDASVIEAFLGGSSR